MKKYRVTLSSNAEAFRAQHQRTHFGFSFSAPIRKISARELIIETNAPDSFEAMANEESKITAYSEMD